jgi:hypothetical protein
MRRLTLLLATLIMIGCGNDPMSKNPDPGPKFGTGFAPPAISSLAPTSVPVDSSPFYLTVNGSNFGTDAIVFWNGVAQHTVYITSKQVAVSVTSTDLDFAGLAQLYVRTEGMTSNTVNFDVTIQ